MPRCIGMQTYLSEILFVRLFSVAVYDVPKKVQVETCKNAKMHKHLHSDNGIDWMKQKQQFTVYSQNTLDSLTSSHHSSIPKNFICVENVKHAPNYDYAFTLIAQLGTYAF